MDQIPVPDAAHRTSHQSHSPELRNKATISQGEISLEEETQTPATTTPLTTAPGSLIVTESTRRSGSKWIGLQTLDQELHICKDRQEKLLQILQAPAVPDVPHPERYKFAEYLGHAFQSLPQSIYRDVQKSMFDLLYYSQKQADVEAGISSVAQAPQQQQQWQPDPLQWQSTPVFSARSVWHSQDPAWVDRQFPGYN